MTVFVIYCDAAVSPEQRAELRNGIPRDEIEVMHQAARVGPRNAGTVTIILAFATRLHFYAFLSQPGTEACGWSKTKSNIARANKVKRLRVEYRIHVGDIVFVDGADEWAICRHERILGAADAVHRRLLAEELWNARCVDLIFDPDRGDYTEARLFRRDYEALDVAGSDPVPPLRVYRL